MMQIDKDLAIFSIAAASELAGMHPQTLRQYDRLSLVIPSRTAGGTRRYSARDIQRLREVQQISNEGVSLEGIRRILELEDTVDSLTDRVRNLEERLMAELEKRPGSRVFAAGSSGHVVSMKFGRRTQKPGQIVRWTERHHG